MQNLDTDPGLSTWHVWWVRTSKPATINPVNSKLFKMAVSTTNQFMHNQNPWRSSGFFLTVCPSCINLPGLLMSLVIHIWCWQLVFPASCRTRMAPWSPRNSFQWLDPWWLDPNGLLLKMAIYSGFSHWKWWFSIVMLVYQRVELQSTPTIHGSSAVSLLSL